MRYPPRLSFFGAIAVGLQAVRCALVRDVGGWARLQILESWHQAALVPMLTLSGCYSDLLPENAARTWISCLLL